MARDEIVDETRRVRDEFAKSHDYDVKKIVRALKRAEASERAQARAPPATPVRRAFGEAEDGLKVDGFEAPSS